MLVTQSGVGTAPTPGRVAADPGLTFRIRDET
jgi:hypothetical protein